VPARRSRITPSPSPSPSTTYVETSALLAALLEQDIAAQQVLRTPGRRVTSALTLAEANRGVVRARVTGRLSEVQERRAVQALETFAARCDVVGIAIPIIERAGRPFPIEPIRTLDAIHLATVEFLGGPPQLLTVLTRDTRVRDNARALGFATV
jgi:predicted nucleic acid-binding protein